METLLQLARKPLKLNTGAIHFFHDLIEPEPENPKVFAKNALSQPPALTAPNIWSLQYCELEFNPQIYRTSLFNSRA